MRREELGTRLGKLYGFNATISEEGAGQWVFRLSVEKWFHVAALQRKDLTWETRKIEFLTYFMMITALVAHRNLLLDLRGCDKLATFRAG